MPERHPITQPISHEDLAERVAQLWDQVWWMALPPERRAAYEAEGHTAPIGGGPDKPRFYDPIPEG